MARDGHPPDASSVLDDGQQLPCPAHSHEPRVVVVVGGEVLEGREADEDDGFGI